jgi:tripartite-type tricarboxylate transporter receptor subunit TctC
MRMTRHFGSVLALLLGLSAAANADTIKVVVPFAAGGPTDMIARLIGQDMQPRLKSDVVIENRGGAGGVIANEAVARAPADGKTLLFATLGSHVISAALRSQLSYDPLKSFTPIAFIGQAPSLIVVSADYPAKTFAELIAKAKAEKLSYGSAGPGTTMNIAGEMFNAGAGVKAAHVPYRGAGPAINDLIGGHIQFLNADLPVLLPPVQSGKLRALAMFGAQRSALLPEVPTSVELGFPGMIMENWYGMLGPAGIPAETRASLEKAALEAVHSPDVARQLAAGGARGATGGKGFADKLAQDVSHWGPELKKLGIQGE